jgi:phage major head subunit gpT-like protein
MSVGLNPGVTDMGVRGLFARGFITRAKTVWYPKITTVVDSTQEEEKFVATGTVPFPEEVADTEPIFSGMAQYSYTLKQREYRADIQISRRAFEFDQTGDLRTKFQSLAARVASHPQYLISEQLKNGTSTTVTTAKGTESNVCFDGSAFFATDHDLGDGTSQSNIVTGALTAAEFETADIKEQVEAFVYDLSQALSALEAINDDRGQPWHDEIRPEGLKIVCGMKLWPIVRAVINGSTLPHGGSNPLFGAVGEIIHTPYDIGNKSASNYTTWYLMKTDDFMQPMLYLRFRPKTAVEFTDPIPEIDEDIVRALQAVELMAVNRTGTEIDSHTYKTGNFLYGARMVYRVGYGMWTNAIKVNGTAGGS